MIYKYLDFTHIYMQRERDDITTKENEVMNLREGKLGVYGKA